MALGLILEFGKSGSQFRFDFATTPPGQSIAARTGAAASAALAAGPRTEAQTNTRFKKFGPRVRFGVPPEDNWPKRRAAPKAAPAAVAPGAPAFTAATPQAIPMLARPMPAAAPPAAAQAAPAAPSALAQLDADLASLMQIAGLDQDVAQDMAAHSWTHLADVFNDLTI